MDKKLLSIVLAEVAEQAVPYVAEQMAEPAEKAKKAVEAVVLQDSTGKSMRVWSAVLATASAIAMMPEVQMMVVNLIGGFVPAAYLPMFMAVAAAVLSSVSKLKDPRATRG
jgi:hypothetical protein